MVKKIRLVVKGVVTGLVTAALVVSCASGPKETGGAADDESKYEPRVLVEADLLIPEFSRVSLDELVTLMSQPYDATELAGKYVLLNIWTTWCPYCESDRALLDAFYRRFNSCTETVLTVSFGEQPSTVQVYTMSHDYAFPVLLDSNKVLQPYVEYVPVSYVIDPEGQVLARIEGNKRWTDPASLAVLRGVIPGLALE